LTLRCGREAECVETSCSEVDSLTVVQRKRSMGLYIAKAA